MSVKATVDARRKKAKMILGFVLTLVGCVLMGYWLIIAYVAKRSSDSDGLALSQIGVLVGVALYIGGLLLMVDFKLVKIIETLSK